MAASAFKDASPFVVGTILRSKPSSKTSRSSRGHKAPILVHFMSREATEGLLAEREVGSFLLRADVDDAESGGLSLCLAYKYGTHVLFHALEGEKFRFAVEPDVDEDGRCLIVMDSTGSSPQAFRRVAAKAAAGS